MLHWMSALAVLSGTGMLTTVLRAKVLLSKPALTFTLTSSRVRPSSLISGTTWQPQQELKLMAFAAAAAQTGANSEAMLAKLQRGGGALQ
jgi:hypothetical protein